MTISHSGLMSDRRRPTRLQPNVQVHGLMSQPPAQPSGNLSRASGTSTSTSTTSASTLSSHDTPSPLGQHGCFSHLATTLWRLKVSIIVFVIIMGGLTAGQYYWSWAHPSREDKSGQRLSLDFRRFSNQSGGDCVTRDYVIGRDAVLRDGSCETWRDDRAFETFIWWPQTENSTRDHLSQGCQVTVFSETLCHGLRQTDLAVPNYGICMELRDEWTARSARLSCNFDLGQEAQ